MNTTTKITKKN